MTSVTSGPYYRDTDPVAGIDLNGNIFLNTLPAIEPAFGNGAVTVSRSTNGGASFAAPVEVYRPPDDTLQPDKNWMAINTFAGTATAGRIVVTFTLFTLDPYPIVSSYSDDGGQSWSTLAYVTPSTYYAQGSQPVFLPNGNLAVVFWNFDGDQLESVTSADGGASYGTPHVIAPVTRYNVPGIRTGSFLPSATADRTNGYLYVTYQAAYQGAPRIMFTKSTNGGTAWTAPQPVSDNSTNAPVFNPAVSVSPDGQVVAITFYDERVNAGQNYLVDLFLAQSFDGGATWQPNLRVSQVSTDASLAPLTGSGYMIGDYLGVAGSSGPDVPVVPVWIDTRSGNPDPYIARVGMAPQLTFGSWRAARLSASQIANPAIGSEGADPDGDGLPNLLEYALGKSPLTPDPSGLVVGAAAGELTLTYPRLGAATDVTLEPWWSGDLANPSVWSNSGVTESLLSDDGTIQLWKATVPMDSSPGMFFLLRAARP